MPMTNYLKNEVLDHLLRGETFAGPVTYYVALWRTSGTLNASSTGSTAGEMAEAGYARQPLTKGTAAFDAAVSGATDNTNVITFGPVTVNASEVDKVAICDALTGGNMLWYGNLATARTLSKDDSGEFAAGALDWT